MSSPSLPFDWEQYFVPDRSVDCLPACVAMAARYWKVVNPQLNIPQELEIWKKYFVEKHKAVTPRGSSIRRIYENLTSLHGSAGIARDPNDTTKALGLTIEAITPEDIRAAQAFLRNNPAVPLSLIYDRSYALTNQPGGYHAVLFHSVDLKKEKIYIIDPSLIDLGRPFPLDLDRFNEGWRQMQNLAIAIYPAQSGIKINTSGESISHALDEFMEGEE